MSNTLKEASGWPHSFHKKIPGLFKENHSFFKDNFKGQKINNQQKLSFEHQKWRMYYKQ